MHKNLTRWLKQGLITAEQQQAILDFEENKPAGSWQSWGFVALGAIISGIGLVSIVAANWRVIPDSLKLGFDFFLLAITALGIYFNRNSLKPHRFDALIIIYLLLCLASIGLISQVYHTGGMLHHAFLFWSVMTLPVVLFARKAFVPYLWVTVFLPSVVLVIGEFSDKGIGNSDFIFDLKLVPQLVALAALFCGFLALLLRQFFELPSFRRIFYFWFLMVGLFALGIFDALHSFGEAGVMRQELYGVLIILALVMSVFVWLQIDYLKSSRVLLIIALALFIWFAGAQIIPVNGLFFTAHLEFEMAAPLISLSILFIFAIVAGREGWRKSFSLVTLMIGVRFLIVYFQAMGGLAATGLGLLISGFLIMAMVWLWHKSRDLTLARIGAGR
ncbi:MAG: hypothetical protein DSZ28_04805 [Thiothrix sp.]|nr:MAG: hypothetical protein DSZ28_04805 [Thiothrix sp.]